ncbi:hypothetical protein K431DRAFT_301398 [Polychaeton citri CBS 116435]|uniref:Uncharacterized protein n=1 Tax=Polychaeton citri CBS 116435 TaxID=1314669 RepID=A0A9P4QDX7_9PEZI|nr:hypothetical protein K431DRAFT_301398 [Polychaeton citri CBS 116435]
MSQPSSSINDTTIQRFHRIFDDHEQTILAELRIFVSLQRSILNYESDMLTAAAPTSNTYLDLLNRILMNLNVQCLLIRRNLLINVRFWQGAVPIIAGNTSGGNGAQGPADLPLGFAVDTVCTTLYWFRRYKQAVLDRITRDSDATAADTGAAHQGGRG